MKKTTSDGNAPRNALPVASARRPKSAGRPAGDSRATQSAQPSHAGGYISRAFGPTHETLAQPTRFFFPVFSMMNAESALAKDDVDAFLDVVSKLFKSNMARASSLLAYFHPELSAAPEGNQAQWRVGERLLRVAAERDAARCVQALLDFARVDPNATQTLDNPIGEPQVQQFDHLWKTPLMIAAKAGSVRAIDVLLANGADPHLADKGKRTALLWAAQAGQPGSIERLLPVSRPTWRDFEGRTALMICAQRIQRDMADPIACLKLLAPASHVNAVNKHKHSALSLAMTKPDAQEVFEAINPFTQESDWTGKDREGRTLLDQAIHNGYPAPARWLAANQRASLSRRVTRNWKGRDFVSTPLIDLMAHAQKPPSLDLLDTLIELSALRDENSDGETALSSAFARVSRGMPIWADAWWSVIDRLASADLGQPFLHKTIWPQENARERLPRTTAALESRTLREEIGLADPSCRPSVVPGAAPAATASTPAANAPDNAPQGSADNPSPPRSAGAPARRRI